MGEEGLVGGEVGEGLGEEEEWEGGVEAGGG